MKHEFSNLLRSYLVLIVFSLIVLGGLNIFSFVTNAGDGAFNSSCIFVFIQLVALMICYGIWYYKSNAAVAVLSNTAKMRKTVFGRIPFYMFMSILLTLGISVIGTICILIRVIFVDIAPVYTYSALYIFPLLGNLLLFLLMRFFGLPNRMTGTY